ncbi:RNA 3'-terminal phosphate cyclase family protein [Emydomyces testavorans]|uniref:RNA 3'-terminal phosphate cyclase family protein n=1 Tax=Emydomyces testavorans TaxID=2070801 RepID=A0AAF0IJ25_9EURO|nr:RNA 3'-terminal phosphate cyclase family protein [Emydomyces testavorans]
MIHLDGSTLEGGGQLVRNAVALSALTSQPVKITRIRAKRDGSRGLRPSHTAAIQCLLDICGGTAVNATVGSSEIIFYPRGEAGHREDLRPGGNTDDKIDDLASPLKPMNLESMTDAPPIQPEYSIHLKTPGSVFLIFQALYPYLLYAGACANARGAERGEDPPEDIIKLNVTGGTNVSFSPSYDYISQVLIPNFATLGLPRLDVELKHRGWNGGQTGIGTVCVLIRPLGIRKLEAASKAETQPAVRDPEPVCNSASFSPIFPEINLHAFDRGFITQIDITVLAPDTSLNEEHPVSRSKHGKRQRQRVKRGSLGRKEERNQEDFYPEASDIDSDTSSGELDENRSVPHSIREWMENYALETVSHKFSSKGKSCCADAQPLKIGLRRSEATNHYSQTYILLVAHTSTGFRLGRDALFGAPNKSMQGKKSNHTPHQKSKGKGKSQAKSSLKMGVNMERVVTDMVDQCVEDLMYELADGDDPRNIEKMLKNGQSKRFLDSYMRDQVVVFQALGKLGAADGGAKSIPRNPYEERDLSLHTQTAMWVCEQMLGTKF